MAETRSAPVRLVGRALNGLLQPAGIKIQRRDDLRRLQSELRHLHEKSQNHLSAVDDLILCVSEFLFPDLLPAENRALLMLELSGTGYIESLYIAEYLRRSSTVDGDVCEFGVAGGATSAFIANEIRQTEKSLWLFDSFEGLSKPTEKDTLLNDYLNLGSMEAYEGAMIFRADEVKARLGAISFPPQRTKIVPGFIENTINAGNLPTKVSFAYVDFDLYQPILIALGFLSKCLSLGGSIVVDDYGYFSSGAKAAVDEFVSAHADRFEMALPFRWTRSGSLVDKFAVITRTN